MTVVHPTASSAHTDSASANVVTPAPPSVLLAHHLKELRLPTCLREYE